jgi:hypothetical protein
LAGKRIPAAGGLHFHAGDRPQHGRFVYNPRSISVRTLAMDPQTSSTLYAGTDNGVFRSIDGGASWIAVNSGLTSLGINSLAIDPRNPSTVFPGTSGGGVFSITFT